MTSEMVKIYVGPEGKEYNLHKELLCDRSSFFKAAFRNKFKEGQENKMTLPADSPEAFDIFVRWIYGSALTPISADHLETHYNLYALAEKLCMEALANQTMDVIKLYHKSCRILPSPDNVLYACQATSCGSGLRHFLIDCTAYHLRRADYGPMSRETLEMYAQLLVEVEDFARDFVLVHEKYRMGNQVLPMDEPNCNYHSHAQTALWVSVLWF
jgi:BTB/POZ domain